MSKSILITGGTGLVGSALIPKLKAKGYTVSILSRSQSTTEKSYLWDYKREYLDPLAFEGVETIVHLAGAGVAEKKWSAERKDEIYNSRTKTSLLLFNELQKREHQVKTFIAASAIGIYGSDTGNQIVKEDAPKGNDFLAHVTDAWETATRRIETLGIRLARLRIGVVLSNKGGALKELLKPPVVAPLGKGNQYMSWIHIDDLCNMIIYAIENPAISGPFNAVGPKAQTNKELTKIAAKAFKKPFLPIPVPSKVLKVLLGEMSSIVLGGSRVSSQKIQEAGFQFSFSKLPEALEDLKNP